MIGRLTLLVRTLRAYTLMRHDFLPPAPDLSGRIMQAVYREPLLKQPGAQEPVSLRNWVLVGFIILVSLLAYPLGQTFDRMIQILGSDLLLPIALTLGIALTLYCSLFIFSHLDELSERFGLHHS